VSSHEDPSLLLVRQDQIYRAALQKSQHKQGHSRPFKPRPSFLDLSAANMQKVIRRTILAERQASRRLAKRKDKLTREWTKTNREQNNYNRKDETSLLKQVRLDRREDWELGPLAPKRDVGDKKDTYGTVSSQRLRGPILEHKYVDEALEPFGGRYLNIVKGDRVVLLEGMDKGKIAKITNVDTKRVECTVEGLNMVCKPNFPSIFFQLVIKTNTLCGRWMLPSPNI
jgi:hypothetical protein